MSEFKFACPVCGQHITCDSGSSGSSMTCPTCFRSLVVPQASVPGGSNLLLTASEVQSRTIPLPGNGGGETGRPPRVKHFPWAAWILGLVVCAAVVALLVFRGRIFHEFPNGSRSETNSLAAVPPPLAIAGAPAKTDTNWTLNLAEVKIPESPVAGQINGQTFAMQRATIRGGMLVLWRGTKWPPDAGMAVDFFAKQAEDLAGKTLIIEATSTNAPRLVVRWKEDQGQSVTHDFHEGYALRVEFGPITGTRLPGNIYLAAPDDAKSYLAGMFDAEIHRPPPKPRPKP